MDWTKRWTRRWTRRIRALVRKEAVERELDEEMELHLELETEKNLRAGMSPEEARRQAAITFGGFDRYKEQVREARTVHPLDGMVQELRLGVRRLLADWRFSLLALTLLALGIGVNATVFSGIRAAILKELPYPEPSELVLIELQEASEGRGMIWSWPRLRVFNEQVVPGGLQLSAYGASAVTFMTPEGAERLGVEMVERSYFEVLGLPHGVGPGFSPDTESLYEVVLSDGFWRQGFGADPGILGGSVVLDGQSFRVVGVASAGFSGLSGSARAWVPLEAAPALGNPEALGPGRHWLRGIGRLQGVPFEIAQERARAAGAAVQAAYPDSDPDMIVTAGLERLQDARVNRDAQNSLLVLAAAAGLVLLTACANLGGLLVARVSSQTRELAVRTALGAGRWRMMRAQLMESLLLAAVGSVLGLFVAVMGSRVVTAAWPDRFVDGEWNLQFMDPASISVDLSVMVFAVGLAIASALLASAVPAWRVSRVDPGSAMSSKAGTGGGRKVGRIRSVLLVAQVSGTLVLLVSAQLLLSTFGKLQSVDRGVAVENVLTFELSLPAGSHLIDAPEEFVIPFVERLRGTPGIVSVGRGCPPLAGYHCAFAEVRRFDGADLAQGQAWLGLNVVDPGFFEVLRVPAVEGRIPSAQFVGEGTPLVVLSRSAARAIAPDGDVVGRGIVLAHSRSGTEGFRAEVVGLIDEILYDSPDRGTMPEALIVSGQEPDARAFMVRTQGDPRSVLPAIRSAANEIDPGVAISGAWSLDQLDADATSDTRLILGLLGLFSVLALAISSAGIWGVVAQAVQARRKELAVRIALGEGSPGVVGRMVRRGMSLVSLGIGIGLLAGWASTRILSAQLFDVDPKDPTAFLAGTLVLGLVSLAASWFPARAATGVEPMTILRSE